MEWAVTCYFTPKAEGLFLATYRCQWTPKDRDSGFFFFCEISGTPPSRVVIDPQWQLRVVSTEITTPSTYRLYPTLSLSLSFARAPSTYTPFYNI